MMMILLLLFIALHELDPAFRKVTLENERLRALVRDLRFHTDPVGMFSKSSFTYTILIYSV
jgi:hypothetical protein